MTKMVMRKSDFEELATAQGVQMRLLEVLNEREDLKHTLRSITAGHSKRKRKVSDLELTMCSYKSKKYPPGDDAPSKSDFAYWRGAQVFEDLEAAKKDIDDWEKTRMPEISGIENQIQKLGPVIANLKEELGSFVIVSLEEIQEPVYNPDQKRYELVAGGRR